MQDLTGQKLGKYHLDHKLGAGGMASVYRSTHPQLNRPVAIKVLPKIDDSSDSTQQRFLREAQAMAALNHPTLIRVYDVDQDGDVAYMVMDLIPGGSLDDRLRSKTPMGLYWACDVIARVAEALDIAHRRGIIHRDIKPSNVLLTNEEDPVIADFGIAKVVQDDEAAELTTAGTIIGTPLYMAPEQIRGNDIDGRADLYALGVVLYQLLTGRTPFSGDMITVITKQLHEPPPPLRVHTPDLPEPLEKVVLRALAKDPTERYRTGAEFAAAIRQALQSLSSDSRVREAPEAADSVNPTVVAAAEGLPPAGGLQNKEALVKLVLGGIGALVALVIVFKIINALFVPLLIMALIGGGIYWYLQQQRQKTGPVSGDMTLPRPKSQAALLQEGLAFYRSGQYPKALAVFNELMADAPQNIDVVISRGLLYYTLGDLPKALDDFNAALSLNGRHSRALYQRALTYVALNQPDAARADLNLLLTTLPAQADLRREVEARLATLDQQQSGETAVYVAPPPPTEAYTPPTEVYAAPSSDSTEIFTPADSPLATQVIETPDPADSPLATQVIETPDETSEAKTTSGFNPTESSMATRRFEMDDLPTDSPSASVTGKLSDD